MLKEKNKNFINLIFVFEHPCAVLSRHVAASETAFWAPGSAILAHFSTIFRSKPRANPQRYAETAGKPRKTSIGAVLTSWLDFPVYPMLFADLDKLSNSSP